MVQDGDKRMEKFTLRWAFAEYNFFFGSRFRRCCWEVFEWEVERELLFRLHDGRVVEMEELPRNGLQ